MGGWEGITVHRDTEGREPQSWAESLALYKHAHSSRPFADEAYAKPRRVTRYEVSRQEAEYNPITQAWRDEGRERASRTLDAEDTLRTQNRAKDRQLAFERGTHDVINHQLRRTGLPDPQSQAGLTFPVAKREQRLAHGMDSMAPFNIISGLSVEEHHWAPPQHRPIVPPPREDAKLRSIVQQPREFNLLSNEYKRNHEQRTAEDTERARRIAAERFWATHDYDLMTSKFHDPDKEARFRQLKSATEAEQPLKQFKKLPPSYQQGEGYVYSITNFSVQNPELYSKFDEKEQRAIALKSQKWEREADIVAKSQEKAEIDQTRTMQRTSHNRYQEATSHGYDIVTNKGYFDKDPAPLPAARTIPKPGHWDSLAQSSNQFWQTRSMATQQRLAARPASEGASATPGEGGERRGSRQAPVPALDIAKAKVPLEMTGSLGVRTGGF